MDKEHVLKNTTSYHAEFVESLKNHKKYLKFSAVDVRSRGQLIFLG